MKNSNKELQNWVAIDGGFGYFKMAYFDESGKLQFIKFMSVLALADPNHKYDKLVEFKGNRYWMGASALLQPSERILDIKDYSSLKKYHSILMHHALKKAGKLDRARAGTLNIVIGLSAAHSDDKETFIKDNLSYSMDGERFTHNSITFQEQGGGATKALQAALRKSKNPPSSFLVVDGGFNTLDLAQVFVDPDDGTYSIASLGAHEGKGFTMVAEQMRSFIMAEYKSNVSLKEATQIIENGRYDLRGTGHDLRATISKMKNAYSKGLVSFLEKKYGEYFDKSPMVYFVGGVAYFIDESAEENFKVVDRAEYYNALGYLLQALSDEGIQVGKRI